MVGVRRRSRTSSPFLSTFPLEVTEQTEVQDNLPLPVLPFPLEGLRSGGGGTKPTRPSPSAFRLQGQAVGQDKQPRTVHTVH
jgi:hypothetical protein